MAKRFGRNQRRRMREQLERERHYACLTIKNERRIAAEALADMQRIRSTSIFIPVHIQQNYTKPALDVVTEALFAGNRAVVAESVDASHIRLLTENQRQEFMRKVGMGIAEKLWNEVSRWGR